MSTQEDNASQQYPLGQAFVAYERRYRHLGDIEFDNSSRRMELRHRLDNFRQHFDRLQTSVEHLLEPLPSTTDSTTSPKKPRARRKKLQSAVKLDLQALEWQLHALDELAEEFRGNDKKQEDAERSFDNAVQNISTKLRRSKLIPESETAPEVSLAPTIVSVSEHPSDASPPIAAELEAYYEAVSTLRNMGERIGELQGEQQEQWERRGVMEDQGQVLDESEEQFLRAWKDILDVAYKDFTIAQAAVEKARLDCDAMNISIPTWAEVNSVGEKADLSSIEAPDEGMVSLPNSMPGISQPTSSLLQPQAPGDLALLSNEPVLHDHGSPLATPPHVPTAKDRIARWIQDTDPNLDPQLQDFPQGTPLAVSEHATPALEQPCSTLLPREHQWSDNIPVSARSEDAVAATARDPVAFGTVSTAHRASSLDAGQGLEVDDDLLRIVSLKTTP
jgi:hypothetical protein